MFYRLGFWIGWHMGFLLPRFVVEWWAKRQGWDELR